MEEKIIIGFDNKKKEVTVDRTRSGKTDFSKKFAAVHHASYTFGKQLKLLLLLDETSMELFLDDGALAMTELFFPNKPYNHIQLMDPNKSIEKVNGKIYPLKAIYAQR